MTGPRLVALPRPALKISVTAAIADAHSAIRVLDWDETRVEKRHEVAAEAGDLVETARCEAELRRLRAQLNERIAKRGHLLDSMTYHVLTWAHLPEDCLICTGEVTAS